LNGRLDAATPGRGRVSAPFGARRRWAWAAAAAVVPAGILLWLALPRPVPSLTEAWLPSDDILEPLVRAAEADPELAGRIDNEIRASIEETRPALESAETLLPAADPLFWEGLSDDDLRAVIATLEKESGLGGPQ
jgi:hypothetical protein